MQPYLTPSFIGKLYSVIRDYLVNLTILVSLGLGMSDQNDQLWSR
jgi:hypothetical protein